MFNKTLISAIALAATTGAAFAQGAPSQGAAMLAQTLGVEPGVYELSDLVRIKEARDDSSDRYIVDHIIDEGRNGVSSRADTVGAASSGADQLALSLGVEPGRYTIGELALIDAAQRDGTDGQAERFIRDGGLRTETGATTSDSPARQQIASQLNVDAADFTLAQLIELNRAAEENDSFKVRTILAEAGVDVPAGVVLR